MWSNHEAAWMAGGRNHSKQPCGAKIGERRRERRAGLLAREPGKDEKILDGKNIGRAKRPWGKNIGGEMRDLVKGMDELESQDGRRWTGECWIGRGTHETEDRDG
jgi:hypothetical protein